MKYLIKLGSITNAQRGQSVLRSKGFKTNIVKIENPDPTSGCGWALEVFSNVREPVEILKANKIKVRGVDAIDILW